MTTSKIAEALNKAQATMTGAKKDKANVFFKSRYADLASVFEAIRDAFAENGLSISQPMDVLENGRTVLITRLMHTSGETIVSRMLLPDIQDPQKMGAAITYYRRFSLMSIAGIPAEDDDGNEASKAVKDSYIDQKTKNGLEEVLEENPHLKEKVLKLCNVSSVDKIKQSQIEACRKYVKEALKNG